MGLMITEAGFDSWEKQKIVSPPKHPKPLWVPPILLVNKEASSLVFKVAQGGKLARRCDIKFNSAFTFIQTGTSIKVFILLEICKAVNALTPFI
jgi:hypothetical protein